MATAKKATKAKTTEAPKLIASFEEACAKLSIAATLPDFSMLPEKHRKPLEAHTKLVIIAQALNDGWEPNWDDEDEYKYYPWFDMEKATTSGSGFAFNDFVFAHSLSGVGSRLAFKTRELATHAGNTFLDLYKEYFVIAPAA